MSEQSTDNRPVEVTPEQPVSWKDLGGDVWSYLTGRGAAINYSFVDMTVEVPRTTGPESERATWKLNGTLRITTSDKNNRGAINGNGPGA